MKHYISNKEYKIEFLPLLINEVKTYIVDKSSEDAQSIFFKTATHNMYVVKKDDKLFFEHLTVDGNLELLPYQNVHAGNDNFFNFGWKSLSGRIYMIVDIYTGESKLIKE